jgi:succinate dehydrogenase (ubiquinone) cytochrome b560 subunit
VDVLCFKYVPFVSIRYYQEQKKLSSFGSPEGIKKELPISPHITVYKFPLPAITSISNRFSAVALFFGTTIIAIGGIYDPDTLLNCISTLKANYWYLVPFVKFSIAFPLVYHFLAGIRHFVWDWSSKGLENIDTMYMWSRILVASSLVISVLLSII